MVYEAQFPLWVSDIHLVSLSDRFHIETSELTDVYSHIQAESSFLVQHLKRFVDTKTLFLTKSQDILCLWHLFQISLFQNVNNQYSTVSSISEF